ncbi:hypothetical protein QFC21_001393 [Naganishia friedmannii]|uniref:Uncharacterized protein n=1 Tax=Naganishia friedmannii TaxID=89922 RepID=A0ACC2W4D0_9TREE|nr:hypothetical protein QFC21_001393 [Naganishia friedmannii]
MKPVCSICQAGLLEDELDEYGHNITIVKVSPCGHVYHRHCVQDHNDYHERHNARLETLSCPICRQSIVSAEGELQYETIFLSTEDEYSSQGRKLSKQHVALTDSAKAVLGLAKELKEESRDAYTINRSISEKRSLRQLCREGVFQQLADWSEKLKTRLNDVQEKKAVTLLADNLQEWLTLSAGIIEACEKTRRLPEVIDDYKTRIAELQSHVRERDESLKALALQHQRQLREMSARNRQDELTLTTHHKAVETKLKADYEKDVQGWRAKYQTAQDSSNSAATALQEQQKRADALEEALNNARNEEITIKARAQKLQHKLSKTHDVHARMQQQIDAYEEEIKLLKAEKQTSERRMREMTESHSARRSVSHRIYDDRESCYDPTANTSIAGSYAHEADESLAVDSPILETPSRKIRKAHPTFRIIPAKESKQRSKGLEDRNIVAPDSDEEGTFGHVRGGEHMPKSSESRGGHARNPFAKSTSHNADESDQQVNQPTGKPRSLQHVQPDVINIPSSDPPSGPEIEAISPPPLKRRRSSPPENGIDRIDIRVVGGKRHEVFAGIFRKPTVHQKAAAVVGNRASGPKRIRRAIG